MTARVASGGVAARYRPERRLEALAEATGLDTAVITAELFESGLDGQAELGRYAPDQLVDRILDRLNHTVRLDELVAVWSRCFEPATGPLDALEQRSVPRALFTNNGPMIDLCLQGPLSDLAQYFDTIQARPGGDPLPSWASTVTGCCWQEGSGP